MPWFQIDITASDGVEYRDEIRAFSETEARTTLEDMGFTIQRMRIKRMKTLIATIGYLIDRMLHPRKYDPETTYEYELERVRKEHPELKE